MVTIIPCAPGWYVEFGSEEVPELDDVAAWRVDEQGLLLPMIVFDGWVQVADEMFPDRSYVIMSPIRMQERKQRQARACLHGQPESGCDIESRKEAEDLLGECLGTKPERT